MFLTSFFSWSSVFTFFVDLKLFFFFFFLKSKSKSTRKKKVLAQVGTDGGCFGLIAALTLGTAAGAAIYNNLSHQGFCGVNQARIKHFLFFMHIKKNVGPILVSSCHQMDLAHQVIIISSQTVVRESTIVLPFSQAWFLDITPCSSSSSDQNMQIKQFISSFSSKAETSNKLDLICHEAN